MFAVMLAGLGLVGGFLSGLLGIGGGVVLIPLLLFVPPLLALPAPTMREVAGMTIVQVFVASALGYLVHRRRRATDPQVVWWMGPGMVLGSAVGGVASRYVSLAVLEASFVGLALAAGPLLLLPPPADEVGEGPARAFSRSLAVVAALAIGVLSGLVGVGGAFLVIPVMIYGLGVPTRVAIGSSLGVLLMSSLTALVAKLGTGQVVVPWSLALCVGTVPGAFSGAGVSRRVPARGLRLTLAILVVLSAVRVLVDLLATNRAVLLPGAGRP